MCAGASAEIPREVRCESFLTLEASDPASSEGIGATPLLKAAVIGTDAIMKERDRGMTTIDVQFSEYVRNVRSGALQASVLATRLQKAAPIDITNDEKKALKVVVLRAGEVSLVQSARDRLAPGKVRPVLLEYTSDWSAFLDALLAKARVPAHVSDGGARAREIATSLFPDGITFTQLDAESAWSEGNRRLERIAQEKLGDTIDELIGADFLKAAEKGTSALADAIGTGEADQATPSTTALIESLARFGKAVGAYGRLLAAHTDEDDPASVQRFLHAVAPIDAHRANMRSGPSAPAPADVPVVPDAPVVTTPATTTTSVGTPAPVVAQANGTSTSNGTPAPVMNGTPSVASA